MNKVKKGLRITSCVLTAIICLMICGSASVFLANTNAVELSVTSLKTANIFFDGEKVSFDIRLKNFSMNNTKVRLMYEIGLKALGSETYKAVSNDNITDSVINLSGGESIKRVFEYDAEKYGIYSLNVSVLDENNNVIAVKTMEFSKAVKNNKQNPYHGICVHLVRFGDAETELSLAKNAGFSMVRDDFTWGEYETVKGKRQLSDRQKTFLKKAQKYNLDILAIVGGDNEFYVAENLRNSHSALPTDIDEFKNFVSALLDEDDFGAVKRIEIQNEPQARCANLDGVHYCMIKDGKFNTDLGDYNIIGSRYAQELIGANEIIKSKRPDIKTGAFSLCLMNNASTDNFISSVFGYLKNSGCTAAPFDAMTIHPYNSRNINGEKLSIGETVEYYKSKVTENGFDSQSDDVWCTEYGKSVSSGVSCTEQAKSIIKDYAEIKSQSFANDAYLYNMAEVSNTYGLLNHSSNADVPYAAKFSYLAVSALNKLTAEAKDCEKVAYDGADIYKFSDNDKSVYMIQPNGNSDSTAEYDFGDTVYYYDMLGNEISKSDAESYFESAIPYYVTHNTKMPPYEQDMFTVSGKIRSCSEDKNVSLTVLQDGVEFDENIENKIIYADQTKTSEDGEFKFNFETVDKFKNLVCYVVSEDDSIPLTIRLSGEINALRLFSGTEEINSLNLDLFDLNNAYISADLSKINKSDECYLICGFYKSNRLVNAKLCFGEMKEEYDISSNEDIDFDEIRLFMFDSPNKCIPLCGASLINGKTENEKRKV